MMISSIKGGGRFGVRREVADTGGIGACLT